MPAPENWMLRGRYTQSCGRLVLVEASTNQSADQQMSLYNLPHKILCRVVNVLLKAELDTGEVFALLFRVMCRVIQTIM
ncbi:auxin response factor 2 [Phtheirospermum japonicum]|uniref:Auxin response factor 2 n=1 Tax=Phtheirospermum japonicum TaxID=374723 RepID=A0A830C7S1_9LAMI|nr:auxin response factor 2 [Phtheirospermum japonicum]